MAARMRQAVIPKLNPAGSLERQKAFQRPPNLAAETHFIKARLWLLARHTKRELTEYFTEKPEQRWRPDVALLTGLSRVILGLLPMAFFSTFKFNGSRLTNWVLAWNGTRQSFTFFYFRHRRAHLCLADSHKLQFKHKIHLSGALCMEVQKLMVQDDRNNSEIYVTANLTQLLDNALHLMVPIATINLPQPWR